MDEITESYKRLKQKAHLGSQYDWLSRYARSKNISGLELSVHVDDKAYWFLKDNVENSMNGHWKLKADVLGVLKIFSCFTFPLLEISKNDMREEAQKRGFIKALERSWFCFNPVKDKPCGTCNPCIYTMEEGMGYRFTRDATLRYKTRHIRKMARAPRYLSKVIQRRLFPVSTRKAT